MKRRGLTRERIIRLLAINGPQTPYAIAEKINSHHSAIHRLLKNPKNGLEALGIIGVRSSAKWRTGLKRSEYGLTFSGMMKFLHLCQERPSAVLEEIAIRGKRGLALRDERAVIRSEIKKAVENYRESYACPLFNHHQFLVKWLGDGVYDLFALAGRDVEKGHIPFLMIAKRLEILRMMETDEEIPTDEKEKENLLVHAFSITFLNLIGDLYLSRKKVRTMPNEDLCNFLRSTISREREWITHSLDRFDKWEAILERALMPKKSKGGEKHVKQKRKTIFRARHERQQLLR